MDNTGTQTQTEDTPSNNFVQWYSDGPIAPPYSRTKEGTIILGAGRDGVAVLSVRGTNGSEAVRLDKSGLTVKNAVGTSIVTVTNTGINVFGTNGSNIVTLDSSGLTIYNGSISIKNSGGTTVMDATGLNSVNNFETAHTQGGINQNITGTAATDITGGSVATSSFSRNKVVMIFYKVIENLLSAGGTASWHGGMTTTVNIDGTDYFSANEGAKVILDASSTTNQTDRETLSNTFLFTLGTGVHNIVLRAQLDASGVNTNGNVQSYNIGYMVLGN